MVVGVLITYNVHRTNTYILVVILIYTYALRKRDIVMGAGSYNNQETDFDEFVFIYPK